jgi:hypothetical protein
VLDDLTVPCHNPILTSLAPGGRRSDADAVPWDFELGSPSALARRGWSRTLLKPGDTVTVSGYQAKHVARLVNARLVVLADGRTVFAASSDGSEQEK